MIDTWLWSHRFFKRYKILHPKICDVWFCFVLILRGFICKAPLEKSFSYNLKRVWKVEITKCELIIICIKRLFEDLQIHLNFSPLVGFVIFGLNHVCVPCSDITYCLTQLSKTYLQIRSWPTFLSRTYWGLSKHTKWVFYTRNIVCLKHITKKE